MRIIRGVLGVLIILIGLVWIGQGLGYIPGSMMTGQLIYAALGLLCVVVGAWLLRSTMARRSRGLRR